MVFMDGDNELQAPFIDFTSQTPPARFGHSALRVSRDLIIIFGGQAGNISYNASGLSYLNDIWGIIDTTVPCDCVNGNCSPALFRDLDVCYTCNPGFTGDTCDYRCLQSCGLICPCNITCRETNQTCLGGGPTLNGTVFQTNVTINGSLIFENGTLLYSFLNVNNTFNITNGFLDIKDSQIHSLLIIFNSSQVLLDLSSKIVASTCLELNDTVVIIDLANASASQNDVKKDLIEFNCSSIFGLTFKIINAPQGVCATTGTDTYSIYVIYSQCSKQNGLIPWQIILPVVLGAVVLIAITVFIVACTVPSIKKKIFPHREDGDKKKSEEEKRKKKSSEESQSEKKEE